MAKKKRKKTGENPLDEADAPGRGAAGAGTAMDPSGGGEPEGLPQYGLAEDILGPDAPEPSGKAGRGRAAAGPGNGVSADRALIKFVTFFLEKEEYGLPISEVQEINRVTEVTRVPNAPEHVRGVINLRGKIVPVIELKKRLNLGATEIGKESRVVVVEYGPKLLGLMVDRVSQVLNLTNDQIEEAPEEVVKVDQNFIKGVGKLEDRMVILLELEEVIGKGVVV